jgi:DNA-binding SARP family transcriptional activator
MGKPDLRLQLLRGFELEANGQALATPPRAVQRVLAFLALHKNMLDRPYIAGILWADCDQARANASLRSAVWRIKRYRQRFLVSTSRQLALAPDVDVDVGEIRDIAWRVTTQRQWWEPGDVRRLAQAGDLLPDWYDEWVQVERERLRQLRLHALDLLCDQLASEGRYAEAIESGLAAIASEPLRESSHRLLIQAHLAEGNAGEAVRQYRTLRHRLMSDLRSEPSLAVAALVAHLTDLGPW